jgi:aconitate hydratase
LFQKPVAESGYAKPLEELGKRFAITTVCPPTTTAGGGAQATDSMPARAHNHDNADQSAKNTSALTEIEMMNNRPTPDRVESAEESPASEVHDIGHGDVLIAAITSCTNTSNPSVMLAAGLLARKAVEKGLQVKPTVKRSLAPGSRVVTEYLRNSGLQPYLDQLGFNVVGYGCTTCIGNSGPLNPSIEDVVTGKDVIAASVLSGNRNFEARVHQSIKANFLMSPPLVVAFALAGRVDIDMSKEPLGKGRDGRDVYLKDIWPTLREVRDLIKSSFSAETFRKMYSNFTKQNPLWEKVPTSTGVLYQWDNSSTYIQEPPFFSGFSMMVPEVADLRNARALAIFGDSVTTDHISPAGAIKSTSPAGVYLIKEGVPVQDFNSYGSRRGNDRVMVRGTFANVRIKNQMVPGVEGGITLHQPDGIRMSIYDAAVKYKEEGIPLIVLAGHEYGTGSSRDWAAKGTNLLGVRVVVAQSFERIHRSNLVGMGVLPLQFSEGKSAESYHLDGSETYDLIGLSGNLTPRQDLMLQVKRKNGESLQIPVRSRIDTPIEVEYYKHGGILTYVLRQLIAS